MPLRDQPAHEPFESRDLELGAALRAWTEAHSASLEIQLHGPLDAPGMDPTWIFRISGGVLEAELVLLYGPCFDVSAFRSTFPPDDLHIGGGSDITPSRLLEMLDELAAVESGAGMPNWLRSGLVNPVPGRRSAGRVEGGSRPCRPAPDPGTCGVDRDWGLLS